MDEPKRALVLELEAAVRALRSELNDLDDLAEQLRCEALQLLAAHRRHEPGAGVVVLEQTRRLHDWQVADVRRTRARAVTAALERAHRAREPIPLAQRAGAELLLGRRAAGEPA